MGPAWRGVSVLLFTVENIKMPRSVSLCRMRNHRTLEVPIGRQCAKRKHDQLFEERRFARFERIRPKTDVLIRVTAPKKNNAIIPLISQKMYQYCSTLSSPVCSHQINLSSGKF